MSVKSKLLLLVIVSLAILGFTGLFIAVQMKDVENENETMMNTYTKASLIFSQIVMDLFKMELSRKTIDSKSWI